jgi:Fe-S oxidoreductase
LERQSVGEYLRALKKLYVKYGYDGAVYGHFGQGCVHSRISFDLKTPQGVKQYRAFLEEAADLVVRFGGSLSGEHGDGQQRAELLPRMYGEEIVQAFREFKSIWDPDWKMNPGKVVDAYRLDENLKLGVDYNPARPPVQFAYRADHGDFAHAALRCVGVGKCRKPDGVDVMCPSYMVLREEKHTTRGRARLLFEMLRGEIVKDGWRSREVKEALDLCLACKGCTNDCPVNVDMPTYKAEFLHHHWKRRLRPRHAYAFGLVDQIARFASKAPSTANFLAVTSPFAPVLKLAAGMSPERKVPEFAPLTLREWFRNREPPNPAGPKVVLWADTFNNYFHTDVGVAAVEVLEAGGWRVVMPKRHVCCGRPLYDFGFLDLAKLYLRNCLSELREDIRAGIPIVGIEPSCVATFKHELRDLMPFDDDGLRLSRQIYHFGEFVRDRIGDRPPFRGKALVWGHCHQKATGGIDADLEVLQSMGVDAELLKGGCCGLAGSWGFESGHHAISIACGEKELLPKVRAADRETVIVANGFSCQTQIEHAGGGQRALHLAQVIKLARQSGRKSAGRRPEEDHAVRARPLPGWRRRLGRRAFAAAVLMVAAPLVKGCFS